MSWTLLADGPPGKKFKKTPCLKPDNYHTHEQKNIEPDPSPAVLRKRIEKYTMIQQREVGQNHHGKTCIIFLILTFSLAEFGHTTSPKKGDIPPASSPSGENIQRGKALYKGLARCVHCHGSAALRRPLTATELFSVIKFGVPGTSHIPYQHLLSDDEIWAIVEYQLHGIGINGCRN
jgi:hypothetical protein